MVYYQSVIRTGQTLNGLVRQENHLLVEAMEAIDVQARSGSGPNQRRVLELLRPYFEAQRDYRLDRGERTLPQN